SPLHFDLSTFDVYGAFAAGATLYPVAPELNLLPHKVAELIRQAELTQWFSVPSILLHMAQGDAVRPNDFPALRRLLWCGEAFPTRGLIHWMTRLPHVTFTNPHGPTEATIASSYYRVPACPTRDREPVPVGTGCGGGAGGNGRLRGASAGVRLRAAPRGGGGACRAATTTRRAATAVYAADALETTGATAAEPERQGRPASAPRPAGSAVSVTGGGARTNGQLLHEIRAIF